MTNAIVHSKRNGFFYLIPYVILIIQVVDVAFGGRSLDNLSQLLASTEARSPIAMWLVRMQSVFFMVASIQLILASWRLHGTLLGTKPGLTICFVLFWMGSVGLNMFFSSHPYFAHYYFYSLFLGLGVLLSTTEDLKKFVFAVRNALTLFLVMSFLALFIKPSLVIESTYAQGYISGIPRFSGFAPYALSLGQIAQVNGLLLFCFPFQKKWMNLSSGLIITVALLLSQSKTAWISTIVCVGVIILYRHKLTSSHSTSFKQSVTLPLVAMVFLAVGMLCAGLIFLDVGTALDNFFNSKAGSKLLELNGREVIWQYALREWFANPFFGYGPLFLDLKQRLLIGLINATHAHSQFIDLLARSGVIGLLSVIPYLLIMMSMAFKANLALRGLAVSLFLVIFIKCISEVPLTLYGYSLELLMQLTLLAILLLSNNKIASAPTDVNIGSLQEAIR